jgi:peptidoglycan DL-endopeptidase CwlO
MVDGNNRFCPGFHRRFPTSAAKRQWDSRECPGPSTEVELSRPSTRRVLTAGAIALAVIAPSVEVTDSSAEAGPPPPNRTQVVARSPEFNPLVILGRESVQVSRSGARQPSASHRARTRVRPAATAIRKAIRPVVRPAKTKIVAVRQEAHASQKAGVRSHVPAARAEQAKRRVTTKRPSLRPAAVRKRTPAHRATGAQRGMSMVIAYARAQLGKRYVRGGQGPNSFDCSGFTQRAYALAGLRLPHSSGAQAARARPIRRSQARAGDLVVGPGHVGIYMGRGMMIDAGNPGTGVVYRRVYRGLHLERL